MSKFLSEVKGFTPVIDILAQELGLMTAVVYGIVWRYCQMEDGVCTASRERIAEHAGISTKTVERHLEKLCIHQYLKDTTPNRRNSPHIYADTGRAKIIGLLSVEVTKTESLTSLDRESYQGKTESLMMKEKESKDTPSAAEKKAEKEWDDLCRITAEARAKEGQWTVPRNGLVGVAIKRIYERLGSDPPKRDSGTWQELADKIAPVLADYGVRDEKAVKSGVDQFHAESPKTFNPFYKSFAGELGIYLGKTTDNVIRLGH